MSHPRDDRDQVDRDFDLVDAKDVRYRFVIDMTTRGAT